MKIKIISFMVMTGYAPFHVGEVFTAPKAFAKRLIKLGVAQSVETEKEKEEIK
jgi:hypothetical protein